MNRSLSIMSRVGTDAQYFDEPEDTDIRQLLESKYERDKTGAMKRILALMSLGKDVSEYFPRVVKNIAAQSLELKKLIYIYLARYAERQPDEALMAINTLQRDLADTNPSVRAMALRAMSEIRIRVAIPLVVQAVKRCARDPSPYVRRCAAHAILKVHFNGCDKFGDSLEELLCILIADPSIGVVAAAVSAFMAVCPDRLVLLGQHYRTLCRLLPDLDEWSQPALADLLMRYAIACWGPAKRGWSVDAALGASSLDSSSLSARHNVPHGLSGSIGSLTSPPNSSTQKTSDCGQKQIDTALENSRRRGARAGHRKQSSNLTEVSDVLHERHSSVAMSGSEGGHGERSYRDDARRIPEDLTLLLKCTEPLLFSRNNGVVMAAVLVFYCLAPMADVKRAVRALLFVPRSSVEIEYIVLANIATLASEMPHLFESCYKEFFVRCTDPYRIRQIKVQILKTIATQKNIEDILREFESYVLNSNRQFVAETIRALGHCALCLPCIAPACVRGLLMLAKKVLAKPVGNEQGNKLHSGKGGTEERKPAHGQEGGITDSAASRTANPATMSSGTMSRSSADVNTACAAGASGSSTKQSNGSSSARLSKADDGEGTSVSWPEGSLQGVNSRRLGVRGGACLVMSEEEHYRSGLTDEAMVVTEAILAMHNIIEMNPAAYEALLLELIRSLPLISVPQARATVVAMMGQHVAISARLDKAIFVALRYMAKNFAAEESQTKLQVLNSTVKVFMQSRRSEDVIVAATNAKLLSYVTDLARYDLDYDIRDRARMIKHLVVSRSELKSLSQRAKLAYAQARQAARAQQVLQKGLQESGGTKRDLRTGEASQGDSGTKDLLTAEMKGDSGGKDLLTGEEAQGGSGAKDVLTREIQAESDACMERLEGEVGEAGIDTPLEDEVEESRMQEKTPVDFDDEEKDGSVQTMGEEGQPDKEGPTQDSSDQQPSAELDSPKLPSSVAVRNPMERVLNPPRVHAPRSPGPYGTGKWRKFLLGTMSHIVGHRAQGYEELPAPRTIPPLTEVGADAAWQGEDMDSGDGSQKGGGSGSESQSDDYEDSSGGSEGQPDGKNDEGSLKRSEEEGSSGARHGDGRSGSVRGGGGGHQPGSPESLAEAKGGVRSSEELEAWLGEREEEDKEVQEEAKEEEEEEEEEDEEEGNEEEEEEEEEDAEDEEEIPEDEAEGGEYIEDGHGRRFNEQKGRKARQLSGDTEIERQKLEDGTERKGPQNAITKSSERKSGAVARSQKKKLLDSNNGDGLEVEYLFSRAISEYSKCMVCVQLFFSNQSNGPILEIRVQEDNSLGSNEAAGNEDSAVVSLVEIDELLPGRSAEGAVHADFKQRLKPIELRLSCSRGVFAAKLFPVPGALVRPRAIDTPTFLATQEKLSGLHKNIRTCLFVAHAPQDVPLLNAPSLIRPGPLTAGTPADKVNMMTAGRPQPETPSAVPIVGAVVRRVLNSANMWLVDSLTDLLAALEPDHGQGAAAAAEEGTDVIKPAVGAQARWQVRFSGEGLCGTIKCLVTVSQAEEGDIVIKPAEAAGAAAGRIRQQIWSVPVQVQTNCNDAVLGLSLLKQIESDLGTDGSPSFC